MPPRPPVHIPRELPHLQKHRTHHKPHILNPPKSILECQETGTVTGDREISLRGVLALKCLLVDIKVAMERASPECVSDGRCGYRASRGVRGRGT